MTLPATWAQLPGPSQLIETIVDDVAEAVVSVVGVSESISDQLCSETAELAFEMSFGDWIPVSTEEELSRPAFTIERVAAEGRGLGCVLWVRSDDAKCVKAWLDHLKIKTLPDRANRACVSTTPEIASEVPSQPGMRARLWSDFVTATDSLVLVEREGRKVGLNPVHLRLKSEVIAALAGSDIAYASQLARQKLSRIMDDARHPTDLLWAGQVGELMRMVDRQRLRLLFRHEGLWSIPHTRKDGRIVSVLRDLEIGDMDAQAPNIGIPRKDVNGIRWLNRIRRAMAHNEAIPWGTLISGATSGVIDFTE